MRIESSNVKAAATAAAAATSAIARADILTGGPRQARLDSLQECRREAMRAVAQCVELGEFGYAVKAEEAARKCECAMMYR